MKDDKFQLVFENRNNLWFAGNPIQIQKVQLLLDNETGREFLVCEILNCGEGIVKYASVDVICYKEDGGIATAVKDAAITGVYALPHGLFGIDSPISLPSGDIKSVKVTPSRVIYEDGNSWRTEGNSGGKVLPAPKPLDYTEAILAQFEAECEKEGAKPLFKYEKFSDYWNCSCGQHNEISRDECVLCRTKREWLEKYTDPEILKANLEKRLNDERNEKIRREKEERYAAATEAADKNTEKDLKEAAAEMEKLSGFKDSVSKAEEYRKAAAAIHAENAKKRTRNTIIAVSVTSAVIIAAAAVLSYIFYFVPSRKYSDAKQLLSSGEYETAKARFEEISGFSDASDKAKECDYRRANSVFDDGNYEEAKAVYESLNGYLDSADKAKECDYRIASALMESGDFDNAKVLFGQIAGYSNADDMCKECDYRKAMTLINTERYTEAAEILGSIVGYSDSYEKYQSAMYTYATVSENFNRGNETTLEYLKILSDLQYKDSAELYKSLTRWNVSIVYNSREDDAENDVTTTNIRDGHYFHLKVNGGVPGESLNAKWVVEINNKSLEGVAEGLADGGSATFGWAAGDSSYNGGAGDMTVKIYDNATGELLAVKTGIYVSSR